MDRLETEAWKKVLRIYKDDIVDDVPMVRGKDKEVLSESWGQFRKPFFLTMKQWPEEQDGKV